MEQVWTSQGRLRPVRLVWNGRPVSSQASASSHFGPLGPFCPPPHIPEHSRAGVSPRTPRAGAPYIPGTRTLPPLPLGWRWVGGCPCVGTGERALPLLLEGGAAGPLRGPLNNLSPFSRTTQEGHVPSLGFIHPPHACSPLHCDFCSPVPTDPVWARSSPGRAWLRVKFWPFLLLGDSCRREGNMVFSPAALFLTPAPTLLRPWLDSLAGSHGPERWG